MQQAAQSRLLTAFLSALSITVAFGLAFWWNLDKPFWAGFSALVVSLSTLGQSIQKGLLRMVGTVTGAVAGLILYFFWGQLRWPMLVMLCLYILLMVFLLLRSRQSSYFFYTSAIVAILIVVQSRSGDTPFTVAVDRMWETLLGILIYTVLALLLWPRSSLEALKAGMFRMTAGFGELLAAQCASGIEATNLVKLNLYHAAQDAVKLTEGLLPAARLESYEVRHNLPEWVSFLQLSRQLLNLQQDFMLRMERLPGAARMRFFPHLTEDLDALAEQYAALGAWRPAGENGEQGENEAPYGEDGDGPPSAPSSGSEAGAGDDILRRNLDLRVDETAVRTVSPLDLNAVYALRDNFSRQSRTTVALGESLRFLLESGGTRAKRRAARAEERDEPAPEWFALTQMRQVSNAAVLYWLSVLLWIYVYPPGSTSTAFVEMSLMVGLVGFMTGRINPVQVMAAFGLGVVAAGFLYLIVMPLMTSFSQLGPLMFAVCFAASYFFYLPAQGMMRTGVILPWFALSGLTNVHVFDVSLFINGALTLMLCAALVALVFYLTQGGHPARLFLKRQRRFLRAAVLCIGELAAEPGGRQEPGRLLARTRKLWAAKLLRDLPSELMALAFAFDEEEQGLDRQSVKLLALDSYGLSRRLRTLISSGGKAGGVGLEVRCVKLPVLAPDTGSVGTRSELAVLRAVYAQIRASLDQTPPERDMRACAEFADALQTYLTSAERVDWSKLAVEAF